MRFGDGKLFRRAPLRLAFCAQPSRLTVPSRILTLMHALMPPRRPRISLLTLLLLLTIFAMGIALWQANSELIPMREEVQALRDETGQLTISDVEQIHAIQMATDYPLAWRWRVYIPEGRKVRLAHETHQISKEELPEANGHEIAGPGEFVVTVTLDKQPDGKWRSSLSCDGVTTYRLFPEDANRWLTEGGSGSQFEQVFRTVSVERSGEPFVLLRKRVFYNRGQIPPSNEPALTDGLLVWLSEDMSSANKGEEHRTKP